MAKAEYETVTTFHVELDEAEVRHIIDLLSAEEMNGTWQSLYNELSAAYDHRPH